MHRLFAEQKLVEPETEDDAEYLEETERTHRRILPAKTPGAPKKIRSKNCNRRGATAQRDAQEN
ncbi:MAG: hypothetical protein ACRESG_09110 [Gammaproteobacteria bacterium]